MAPLQFRFDASAPAFPGAEVLDCSSLGGVRRYCDPAGQAALKERAAGRWPGLHLLDSGDYHYLTKILADQVPEPFDLILFDHHPDMQVPAFEGVLSCGGWLRDMLLENPMLQQVTIVGIDPSLLVETEGFGDRVRVFCEGDTVVPDGRLLPVYVSVDKDVFCKCFASTNWDQGSLTLSAFTDILSLLAGGRRMLGADICGGISFAEGGTERDLSLNCQTDKYLINLFK